MDKLMDDQAVIDSLVRAVELQNAGQIAEAEKIFLQVDELKQTNVAAIYSLAVLYHNSNQYGKALKYIDRALAIRQDQPYFFTTRQAILEKLRVASQSSSAISEISAASLSPVTGSGVNDDDYLKALQSVISQCEAFEASGQSEKSIQLYKEYAAQNRPNSFLANINLATLYFKSKDYDLAIACLNNVIAVAPGLLLAHTNLGTVYEQMGRPNDALAAWEKSLTLPQMQLPESRDEKIKILNNLGRLHEIQREYEKAEHFLHESLLIDGAQAAALQHWIHLRQRQCKWPVLTDEPFCQRPIEEMASPMACLDLTDQPSVQLACAKRFIKERVKKFDRRVPKSTRYNNEKIKIGYASADLSMHAVSLLTVQLFELHNRSDFEVHAFCWSPEDGTPFRQRVKSAFDFFHPIGGLTDDEAANLIQQHKIDVLVDLQGLSGRARPDLIAQGAAPIQIAYLGFPGTTALPYVDYVIADEFIFPEALKKDFSEAPIYLKTVFQVSDSTRPIGAPQVRANLGLKEDDFVFCCFNNNFKFNEKLFLTWLDIIKSTSNSVLWILEDNTWAKQNLINFAKRNNVNEDRLVFAGRIEPKDYLARFQCADIFLDTYPYNAGTTANDLLFAGLPLLTLSGSTYASRMAGSLVHSLGLDELICRSHEEYRDKAIYLANHRDELREIRQEIQRQKDLLFDMMRVVREYEDGIRSVVKVQVS